MIGEHIKLNKKYSNFEFQTQLINKYVLNQPKISNDKIKIN